MLGARERHIQNAHFFIEQLFMLAMARHPKWKRLVLAARFRRAPRTNFAEPVSVVIAAYNEKKLIAETLRTLFATDYKAGIEVVIVDDGSTDQTAAEIERIAQKESRIRLLQQENHGKARALQRGRTVDGRRHEPALAPPPGLH